MFENDVTFLNGAEYVRADFHLHTLADRKYCAGGRIYIGADDRGVICGLDGDSVRRQRQPFPSYHYSSGKSE